MKKFLVLFTVIALILTLTAVFVSCGDKDGENSDTQAVTTTEAVSDKGSDENTDSESEQETTEPIVTDTSYYDGIPDDTANDIIWTKNH